MTKKEKKPKLKLKKKDAEISDASSSDKSEANTSEKKSPKYEVNFADGIDQYDLIGLLLIPFIIIWALIKIILFPAVWVWRENAKMVRFWWTSSHHTTLTRDERDFVESLPLLYTITGIVAGVFFGIIAAFGFGDEFRKWIDNLDLSQGFTDVLNFIGTILKYILEGVIVLVDGIGWVIGSILGSVGSLLQKNPFGALSVLIVIILVGTMIIIAIKETGILDFLGRWTRKLYYMIIGTPGALKNRFISGYRSFNSWYAKFLYTEERLNTRTQVYFKNVIGFTFLVTILIFIAGISVSFNYYSQSSSTFATVSFFAFVMFLTGLVSGWCLGIFGWYLDFLSRGKYIAESAKGEDPEELPSETESEEDKKISS